MIKPLRKYHLVVWQVLAALLPLAFVMAIVVRPVTSLNVSGNTKELSATIDPHTDSTSIIIINVGAIKGPSCVAILSNQSQETVLGTLNERGPHVFIIPKIEEPSRLKLWDAFRKKAINSIPLGQKN